VHGGLAQNLRKGRHTASAAFKTMEETEWKNATAVILMGPKLALIFTATAIHCAPMSEQFKHRILTSALREKPKTQDETAF
jgi:hypothetical protein